MAKMKMNKVDFKRLLVEKGERIALGVAGGACVLMIVPMFWFLLFGPSSKGIVKDLNEPAATLKSAQASASPTEADKPPPPPEAGAVVFERKTVDSKAYPFAPLFMALIQEDASKRQMPRVQVPLEARVAVTHVQLESYVMNGEPGKEKIMVLTGGNPSGMGPMGMSAYNQNLSRLYQQPGGRRPGGPGGSGYPGYPGAMHSPYQGVNQQVGVDGSTKADLPSNYISVEDIANLTAEKHLADTVQPVRMAVIAASFPYKLQVEEFKNRLHLPSDQAVVDETVEDKVDETGLRHTFYFLSPIVERRQVDVHGQPLTVNDKVLGWEPLNLGASYLDLLRVNGMRFEPETTALDMAINAVSFDGLTMQKMAAMGKNQYPDVETRLTTLQPTLKKLEQAGVEKVVKPNNPISTNGFDPFRKQPSSDLRTNPMGPTTTPMKPLGIPMRPATTFPMRPTTTGPMGIDPNAPEGLPDCCLIRLIDVTVQPGRFYQYRFKVRMANPNLGMKNVASPSYAIRTEPLESDWFEVRAKKDAPPQTVAVPPEYHLYTVDQQEIDNAEGKTYYGQNKGANKDRQAALQIHKWLAEAEIKGQEPVRVGEWSVAERVLVFRGEYVGRQQRVEVPYWRSTQEAFVLAMDKSVSRKTPLKGLELDFGPPIPAGTDADPPYYPILVDFEGGQVTHSRVAGKGKDGKDEVRRIDEKAGVETLILSPEGKLLAQHSWTDKTDAERVQRLDTWRNRIKEVKEGKATGTGGDPKSVFGSGTGTTPMPMPNKRD